MNKLLLLLIAFFTLAELQAQILVTRNLIVAPGRDSSAEGKVLHDFSFGGEIARGGASLGGEMAWAYKLLGYAEIYRFSAGSSISLLVAHELNANPHNDINFNPRKAVWEENLRYYHSGREFGWMTGFYHRCKHDIDNSQPPHEDRQYYDYVPELRIIVLTGLNAGIYHHAGNNEFSFRQQLTAEYYLYSEESRTPYPYDSASWDELAGSVRWSSSLNYHLSSLFDIRLSTGAAAVILDSDKPSDYNLFNFDYRIETSLVLKGHNNSIDFFGGYERIFDETAFIYPEPTTFWNLGLRFRPHIFR